MGTINGQDYQHALLDVRMASPFGFPIPTVTFSAISCKVSAEKKPVYDSQGQIIRYTIDNQKIDASITLLMSEYRPIRSQIIQQFAAQVPPLGILQVQMDWTISFGNSTLNYRTDNWRGVMFQVDPLDSKNDQEALLAEIPLFVQRVEPDGIASIIYRPY